MTSVPISEIDAMGGVGGGRSALAISQGVVTSLRHSATRRVKDVARIQIIKYLGSAALTWTEIAQTVGCSRATVARVAKEVRESERGAAEEIGAYRRAIALKVPMNTRVDTYADLIRQKKERKVQLQALIRVDQLLGHHTEVELRTRESQPQISQRIVFPPGTSVKLTRVTETMEVSPAADTPPAIDLETEQS